MIDPETVETEMRLLVGALDAFISQVIDFSDYIQGTVEAMERLRNQDSSE